MIYAKTLSDFLRPDVGREKKYSAMFQTTSHIRVQAFVICKLIYNKNGWNVHSEFCLRVKHKLNELWMSISFLERFSHDIWLITESQGLLDISLGFLIRLSFITPTNICLFKFNKRKSTKLCEVCSKLRMETAKRRLSFSCFNCWLWTCFTSFSSVSIISLDLCLNFDYGLPI